MSGGVDSSVSAFLIKESGMDCMGTTMRLYENDMIGEDLFGTCCSAKDTEDARAVCEKIGIDYRILHYEAQFEEQVIAPFVCAYENARTPNPCIECNRKLKFTALVEKLPEWGCDYLVTGHYARIEKDEETGRFLLKKAVDPTKDQSYVLYMMNQELLSKIRFPLGNLTKEKVREIAQQHGFVNAAKQDSQDICFVPDGDYVAFMQRYRGKKYPEGNFVDKEGNILGRHKGIVCYTIGQRKGLGISSESPYYVTAIRPETNEVVLGSNEDLFTTTLVAGNINLITTDRIEGEMHISAKIRYRHKEEPATVTQIADDRLQVVFDKPQRAITPGQAVVLYDGDVVVGGGTILYPSCKETCDCILYRTIV
ncbi:MAG: tRNA 2-thiouridine(34) synthase MnmA [Lachnospiraceae bacterium]|nr:tRNA 2-thiouridine(34) synthase MnmA [Lachnospiraceae bacterium]